MGFLSSLAALPHIVGSSIATHRIIASATAAALVAGSAGAVAAVEYHRSALQDATVVNVVDGDTIDVAVHGTTKRVRLLNVNAPESVDPHKPVQCGGPEASSFLKDELPVGSKVRLGYDKVTQDKYGRDLAAVYRGDMLIDAEIARNGWGVAMCIGDNVKYLSAVKAAQAEAQQRQSGVFSPSMTCTLQSKVNSYASSPIPPDPARTGSLAGLATLTDQAASQV